MPSELDELEQKRMEAVNWILATFSGLIGSLWIESLLLIFSNVVLGLASVIFLSCVLYTIYLLFKRNNKIPDYLKFNVTGLIIIDKQTDWDGIFGMFKGQMKKQLKNKYSALTMEESYGNPIRRFLKKKERYYLRYRRARLFESYPLEMFVGKSKNKSISIIFKVSAGDFYKNVKPALSKTFDWLSKSKHINRNYKISKPERYCASFISPFRKDKKV